MASTEAILCKNYKLSNQMTDALTTARVTDDAVVVRATVQSRTGKALVLRDLAVLADDGWYYLTELGKDIRTEIVADREDRRRTQQRLAEIAAERAAEREAAAELASHVARRSGVEVQDTVVLKTDGVDVSEILAAEAADRIAVALDVPASLLDGASRSAATDRLDAVARSMTTDFDESDPDLVAWRDRIRAAEARANNAHRPSGTQVGVTLLNAMNEWPAGTRVEGVDAAGVRRPGTVYDGDHGVVSNIDHENYGRAYLGVWWDAVASDPIAIRRSRPFVDELTRI